MNYIKTSTNIILYQAIENYKIRTTDVIEIFISVLLLPEDDAEQYYLLLKNELNNTIEINKNNTKIKFLLKECYNDTDKIIMGGQIL